MIHGLPRGFAKLGAEHREFDWTEGCIAVTNAEIEEIWRAIPDGHADSDQAVTHVRRQMRTSILVWSTVSGAMLGLFIDATLHRHRGAREHGRPRARARASSIGGWRCRPSCCSR